MRKIGIIVLLVFLTITISGCNNGDVKNTNNTDPSTNKVLNENKPTQPSFLGQKGEVKELLNNKVAFKTEIFDDNKAHYFNTQLPAGKTVYYFIVKDMSGVYRTAANACQVCHDSRMGFYQEGNNMVCKTCGNKYPLNKIATEKGGCNPGPINPNLKVVNGEITIGLQELIKVIDLF